jgi:ABC-type lipoprotein release transport system permease subunit
VLAEGLARRLEAEVGGEVVAFGQAADGSIAAGKYKVVGIIDAGNEMLNMSLAVGGLETMQELFVLQGKLHEWGIKVSRPLEANTIAESLDEKYPGLLIRPWQKFIPQLGETLGMVGAARVIMAIVFYFAVVLVAANTMYMSFFERMREFGVMQAVGLKKLRISGMIILEGLFMSCMAALAGGLIGLALTAYLVENPIDLSMFYTDISWGSATFKPRLRWYWNPENFTLPISLMVAIGFIVALFPALKLRKMRPVDVLKEV